MIKFNWQIIGHKPIISYLQAMISNNTLGHAYLFYGLNGLGKNTLAQYFIKSIYCCSNQSPCDSCAHCRQIVRQIHPDIIYLEGQPGKKNITIEQVRQVKALHGMLKRLDREQGVRRDRVELAVHMREVH